MIIVGYLITCFLGR